MAETLQLMGQGFLNALTLVNILAMAGSVAIGIVIIFAVGIDTYRRKSLSGGR